MDMRASRTAVTTQVRTSQDRATRNRILFKTPLPEVAGASAQSSDALTVPRRMLFVAGDSMHTELILMVLFERMTVTMLSHAGASSPAISLQTPDVILLDWDTEGVDGEAFLRGLRANPELSCVPIILLTNRIVSECVRRELATFGVHWILEKPIVPLSLPKLVERTIENARRVEGSVGPQLQRSALLVECGQTASSAGWKAM